MTTPPLFAAPGQMYRAATVSADQLYRYDLVRRWADEGPVATFVMLNPSTAGLYRSLLRVRARDEAARLHEWLAPLAGRDLACWCPLGQPCHADVLLELANAEVPANA